MGLLEDTLTEGLGSTVAIGAGAIILGPVLLPIVGGVLRPLAKAAIKGGLYAYYQGGRLVAEARETMEDLVAESKNELDQAGGSNAKLGGAEKQSEVPVREEKRKQRSVRSKKKSS